MKTKRLVIIDRDGIDLVVVQSAHPALTGPHWDAAERVHQRVCASRTLVSIEVRVQA